MLQMMVSQGHKCLEKFTKGILDDIWIKRNYGSGLFYFVICVNNRHHFKSSLAPIRNGINHW